MSEARNFVTKMQAIRIHRGERKKGTREKNIFELFVIVQTVQ